MIGITERGDAALDTSWTSWVEDEEPAILITKDPGKLWKTYERLCCSPNVIVHCTITGFGGTKVEPNVPKWRDAVDGMRPFLYSPGVENLVLRVDPIICTPKGVDRAELVINTVKEQAPGIRVRISFLDMYDHVKRRFGDKGVRLPYGTFHAPLRAREEAWERLGKPEVCGEPGMVCTGCVSAKDCELLGVTPSNNNKGQRKACACLSIKKELLNNKRQCAHGCLYCYWR